MVNTGAIVLILTTHSTLALSTNWHVCLDTYT